MVSLGLSTKGPVGITPLSASSSVCGERLDGRRRGGCGRVSGVHADGERTAAPAARLTPRVEQGLGFGLALFLLQSALLDQWRTDDAAALLADPAAVVSDLLQRLLRRQRLGLVLVLVREAARLIAVWPSEVRILTHRDPEYRRIRTKPRTDPDEHVAVDARS